MEATPEKLAYVALLNPTTNNGTDAMAVMMISEPVIENLWQRREPGGYAERRRQMITLDGTRAVRACARTPRIRIWRDATSSCPGCSNAEFIFSIPSPTRDPENRESHRAGRSRSSHQPHTAHCGPDGIYLNALGSVDGNEQGGILMIDPRPSTSKGPGKPIADLSIWHTTSGGISGTTPE